MLSDQLSRGYACDVLVTPQFRVVTDCRQRERNALPARISLVLVLIKINETMLVLAHV